MDRWSATLVNSTLSSVDDEDFSLADRNDLQYFLLARDTRADISGTIKWQDFSCIQLLMSVVLQFEVGRCITNLQDVTSVDCTGSFLIKTCCIDQVTGGWNANRIHKRQCQELASENFTMVEIDEAKLQEKYSQQWRDLKQSLVARHFAGVQ